MRDELDGLPDSFVAGKEVKFGKCFGRSHRRTRSVVPFVVIDRARSLHGLELVGSDT